MASSRSMRAAQRGHDFVNDALCYRVGGEIFQNDGEFIAAQPRHGVRSAYAL
jgi:hypothetical protein